MDDNMRATAEAMTALAGREMDFSRVRAVRVRFAGPDGAMELEVESEIALDAEADAPEAGAVFTAAVPAGGDPEAGA